MANHPSLLHNDRSKGRLWFIKGRQRNGFGLAFLFGYAMTVWPLRRAGMAWTMALGLALASDTWSMGTMELADNAMMLVIPGAMDAGLTDAL